MNEGTAAFVGSCLLIRRGTDMIEQANRWTWNSVARKDSFSGPARRTPWHNSTRTFTRVITSCFNNPLFTLIHYVYDQDRCNVMGRCRSLPHVS